MSQIRIYGDQVLRKKSATVVDFNDELSDLAEQMIDDMIEKDGVGLAAPQVGRSIKLIITDHTAGDEEPLVFVNPEITWSSEETNPYNEGCLSIPNINIDIIRSSSISVTAQNLDGEEFVMERVEGLLARVIQHEVDHLNGILFVDRASVAKRALVAGKLKKIAKSNKK